MNRKLEPAVRRTRLPSLLPAAVAAQLVLGACAGAPPVDPGEPDLGGAASPGDLCQGACGAACVDVQSDAQHCGACDRPCGDGGRCVAGRCEGSAPPDFAPPAPAPRGCAADPPPGLPQAPAAPPYSGGACPRLVPGRNVVRSTGHERSFLLTVPRGLVAGERLPVLFLWHWLGGKAQDFIDKGEVQAAADEQRFLAIAPESKKDMLFQWPFDIGVSAARLEEEFRFFDDMLSCAEAQFNVNRNCVATAGVSAGALFTDQLAGHRSQYLSSAMSMSGGVDGFARPFGPAPHKLPFLVLWGGDKDTCAGVINFKTASLALETALDQGGHFYLECLHNCGHAEPPIDAPMGRTKFAAMWQFALDHPYWLPPGASPYRGGVPRDMPAWCGVGRGSAVARTGMCPSKSGC